MKRVLSILLLLSMLAGTFSIGAAAQYIQVDDTFTLGDVNGDGYTDAVDAFEVVRYLADVEGASVNRNSADMDADGDVTAYDSLQFRLCLAEVKQWSDYETTSGYGEAMYNFTIAGNPIDTYCITVPAELADNTEANRKVYGANAWYAADQMRKYTLIATGFELPVVKGEKTAEHAIAFHIEDEEGELGVEGYIYEVKDGDLHIYGTRRGCMYAVYDILEDYIGYRFYHSEMTMIYKNRTADIPEGVHETYLPIIKFREVAQSFWNRDEYYIPRKLNGSNSTWDYYYGTSTGSHFINAHSFQYQYKMYHGPAAPEGTERPLSYRYDNGPNDHGDCVWNPCFTSDDVYEQLFEGMILIARMLTDEWRSHTYRRETSYMSFSPNDTDGAKDIWCHCADCSTLYASEGIMGAIVYMANRAAADIQEYYPGMKILCGIYDHAPVNNIYPDKNLAVYYWGNGCNNHILGSGECGDYLIDTGLAKRSNTIDELCLKQWGDACAQTGAELWFWEYPVTYHYYLVGCPNILNLYYDYKYLVEECNVTGIYHEGGGQSFHFETLKAYLSSRMFADPDMTEEEYLEIIKEYLYMYYGDGYEELYQYIMMQNEAGDRVGCFINNYDRPRQMYDYKYIDEHYEEMRALIESAMVKVKTYEQSKRLDTLLACCDFLGLSCVHYRYYKNPESEELRKTYMKRYDNMYEYIQSTPNHQKRLIKNGVVVKDNRNNPIMVPGMEIFDALDYVFPDNLIGDDRYKNDPMYQFYGEERSGVTRYP